MVGAALGLALTGIGLRVAVLDRRKPNHAGQSSGDPRGLVLAPASRRILEALGLWGAIGRDACAIEHIHVSDRGRFGFTHLDCGDVGMDALGYVCRADRLTSSMDSALETASGCDLYWATRVERTVTSADRVTLSLLSGDVEHELCAPLLVGADGVNSIVRQSANIDARTRDYRQTAVVANLAVSNPWPATAFERFTKEGPVALLPLNNDRWASVRVVPTARIDQILSLSDEQYLSDLTVQFSNRLGSFSDLGVRHTHRLGLSQARSVVAERRALVGAAANSIHPNAAQGLNLGLRDIAVLAECIADASRAAADIGARCCLQRYADGRTGDHGRVVVFTDVLAQAFATNLIPITLMRNAAMIAVDLVPALKRRFILSAMGLAGPQPRLVRGHKL